jgi:hypothetical protein
METNLHALLSVPPRNFSLRSAQRPRRWSSRVALADAAKVSRFGPQPKGSSELDDAAISYRHDWGDLDTSASLFLEWDSIDPSSRVFVSLMEFSGGCDAGNATSSAKCSLFDVVPQDGGIGIRVNVEGGRPVRLLANYLVINARESLS